VTTDRPRRPLDPTDPLFGIGYADPTKRRLLKRLDDHRVTDADAPVAEEVPIALVYNARPHVVMMGTPADLEDFAVGFSLTEEIVSRADEIERLDVSRHAQGIEIAMAIPEPRAAALATRGRQLVGRTGCGLCGVETIAEAVRDPRKVGPAHPVAVDALWRAEACLAERQIWNRETGAMHAAAWVTRDGTPEIVREDVGRHNALDKVVGWLARSATDPANGFVLITSRASYELVQKAAVAGIGLLAAVSRPTGLAIRLAQASGLTLVALVRGRTANVYVDGGHLALEAPPGSGPAAGA
jgi:FdhD protein